MYGYFARRVVGALLLGAAVFGAVQGALIASGHAFGPAQVQMRVDGGGGTFPPPPQ